MERQRQEPEGGTRKEEPGRKKPRQGGTQAANNPSLTSNQHSKPLPATTVNAALDVHVPETAASRSKPVLAKENLVIRNSSLWIADVPVSQYPNEGTGPGTQSQGQHSPTLTSQRQLDTHRVNSE